MIGIISIFRFAGPNLVKRFRPDLGRRFISEDPDAIYDYIFHCNAQNPSYVAEINYSFISYTKSASEASGRSSRWLCRSDGREGRWLIDCLSCIHLYPSPSSTAAKAGSTPVPVTKWSTNYVQTRSLMFRSVSIYIAYLPPYNYRYEYYILRSKTSSRFKLPEYFYLIYTLGAEIWHARNSMIVYFCRHTNWIGNIILSYFIHKLPNS